MKTYLQSWQVFHADRLGLIWFDSKRKILAPSPFFPFQIQDLMLSLFFLFKKRFKKIKKSGSRKPSRSSLWPPMLSLRQLRQKCHPGFSSWASSRNVRFPDPETRSRYERKINKSIIFCEISVSSYRKHPSYSYFVLGSWE